MTNQEIKAEARNFFEINKTIYYLAYFFIFVGLVLGIMTDIEEQQWFLVYNDIPCQVFIVLFFFLGVAGTISRGRSLGFALIFGLYLFYIEIFAPGYDRVNLANLYLFNMILIAVYSLLGGFLLDRRVSLIFGFTSLVFSSVSWWYIGGDFLNQHMPLLLLVILAFALLLFYYRGKLEFLAFDMIDQRRKVEQALGQLQVAQKQIIVQEKLASLGALTAGIAHEIKNPLNFVNNFAQSSVELMKELDEHFQSFAELVPEDKREDVLYLLGELKQNMADIESHGKRGNSIVMNMLEHSRTGDAVKRPTPLHPLLDEAWQLAYHGFRARENEFTAELIRDYDPKISEVELITHEMNRVFLNIIGNGLYAGGKRQGKKGSLIRIQTKLLPSGQVEIRIRDNGSGISPDHLEKIFTPFFTTKPTGEGTGLGLSISHDIISSRHQGSLEVESVENEYTEFIIRFPVSSLVPA